MTVSEAKDRLAAMLVDREFDFSRPDPRLGWTVFKRFAREHVVCADDGLLFQIGVYDFTGSELCYLDFVRQFSIESSTEGYGHMEQLHLQFTCEPTDALREIETNLWAYSFSNLDAYVAAVEGRREFRVGMSHTPWNVELFQEQV